MTRKNDLERAIRESYGLIAEYEAILRTSDRPEEKARARRAIDEQWSLVEGCLAEYRPLVGNVLPEEIVQIAGHFSALVGLTKVEQAIEAQEALRSVLPDDQLEATLKPFQDKQALLQAQLWGSGAIAQDRSVAAGAGGVAVGRDVQGDVFTSGATKIVHYQGPEGPKPADLRRRYLLELARETNRLPWMVVEQDFAHPERGEGLALADVYTALDTTELEHVEREEELRRFLAEVERGEVRRISAQEVVNREKRLVVLGDPGAGKSTLVNHLAHTLARAGLAEDPAAWLGRLTPWDHGPLLPVRVELRALAAEARGRAGTAALLLGHLQRTLEAWQLGDFWPSLEAAIRDGGDALLLLLDGLDEVPIEVREPVVSAIQDFGQRYQQHRYLVTCRPYAYVGQPCRLRGFREVTLAPFNEEQVDGFVKSWYGQLARRERLSAQEAQGGTERLQRAVRRQDLWGLAQRPLLLTVMALLHTYRGRLPEDRTELYADVVDLLLRRWESRVSKEEGVLERLAIPGLKMSDLEAGLYEVAFRAHQGATEAERTADIHEGDLRQWLAPYLANDWNKAGAFVAYIRERAGLLIRHKTEAYTFPHRTFQEFMAACYLAGMKDYGREAARLAREEPARWREVFVLAAGHAARTHQLGQAIGAVNALCPREVDKAGQLDAAAFRRAQLAAEALWEIGLVGVRREEAGLVTLERVRCWLVAAMAADKVLEPRDRAGMGDALAHLGDPRPGVGLAVRAHGADQSPFAPLPDIAWCQVPGGPFWMDDDKQRKLPPFWIARYPITNAQYAAFVEDGGYTERWQSCWTEEAWEWKKDRAGPRTFGGVYDLPNHPVVGVTWYEATAYCRWLTERLRAAGTLGVEQEIALPVEEQWVKAARGGLPLAGGGERGGARIYPWGDEADPNRANCKEVGIGTTSAVGCFPGGASPCGAQDMGGNIWEWTASRYEEYDYLRVLRGGAYYMDVVACGVAARHWLLEDHSDDRSGFRCVSPILVLAAGC